VARGTNRLRSPVTGPEAPAWRMLAQSALARRRAEFTADASPSTRCSLLERRPALVVAPLRRPCGTTHCCAHAFRPPFVCLRFVWPPARSPATSPHFSAGISNTGMSNAAPPLLGPQYAPQSLGPSYSPGLGPIAYTTGQRPAISVRAMPAAMAICAHCSPKHTPHALTHARILLGCLLLAPCAVLPIVNPVFWRDCCLTRRAVGFPVALCNATNRSRACQSADCALERHDIDGFTPADANDAPRGAAPADAHDAGSADTDGPKAARGAGDGSHAARGPGDGPCSACSAAGRHLNRHHPLDIYCIARAARARAK
jgi:hypothetical protein